MSTTRTEPVSPAPGPEALALLGPGRRLAVRWLLLLLLAAFVAQLLFTRVESEPWPALAAPSFGGRVPDSGVKVSREPVALVTYAGGATARYTFLEVMAPSQVLAINTWEQTLGPHSTRWDAPSVQAWLAHRFEVLGGGRRPVTAVLQERDVTRRVDGTGRASVRVTHRWHCTFEGS